MGRPIKKGSTDQSTVIRIIDSTDGTPENAVEHDSPGIDLWWRREQETKTSITEVALATLDAAHSDGGIELIGDGYYRLDLPDAAVAAGSGENSVQIGGTVTEMIVMGNEHALVDYDPYASADLGLTILSDWADGGRLDLLLDAIPTTAMRGTDNAALASVVGALADAAAAGEVTEADTLIQYIKQLINILIGAAGIAAFPAEAAPANAVSLAEVIRAIHADVTGLNGDAMRGTNSANTTVPDAAGTAPTAAEIQTEMEENGASHLDTIVDELANATDGLSALKTLIDAIPTTMVGTNNAALASVCTEARLAELAAANVPADVDTLLTRITAAVALASVCTETRLAELAAANLPADIDNILLDTGTDGVVLKAAGLNADAVDEILDEVVEGTLTLRQCIRLFLAALAGKSTGGGTVTVNFRDNADGKNRIVATVDANGNRTEITLDGA